MDIIGLYIHLTLIKLKIGDKIHNSYGRDVYLIIIIIIIIIINCNWVVIRWQWLFYMYTKYEIV